MSHQSWLEAPYTAAANLELAYERFMEEQGIEEGEYTASELELKFEQWVEDQADAAAEERWERDRDADWENEY